MALVGEGWFSVRCLFHLKESHLFEERVVVWNAPSFEEAIALAEVDAEEYAHNLEMEYLGVAQAYALPDPEIRSGSEVFSLMRESDEDPASYVRRYFSTGTEIQRSYRQGTSRKDPR